jgi:signal peptidase II
VTGVLNIFADRLTKILAEVYLKGNESISFFYNVFILCYAENTGAFLSLGRNWPPVIKYMILLIIPIGVCLCVVIYCIFKEKSKTKIVLFITIVSGGLSNLFDRVFNDFSVIDFMNFGILNLRTGIINVADLSVTFGIAVLILYELIENNNKKN